MDIVKSEYGFYIFSGLFLCAGLAWAYIRRSLPVALLALVFTVVSSALGYRRQRDFEQKEEIISNLIDSKSDIEGELLDERERKEALLREKRLENQRLANLKRALRRKGVDTEYLIEEHGSELRAPIMILTHFSAPDNNSKENAEFIRSNLDALGAKTLHGSAKIIPPRNFKQEVVSREDLEKWFEQEVLAGRDDLSYKLEMLAIPDLARTFDRDNSVSRNDGRDFETHTVSSLFETDTVVPTEDLLEILSRSDRISLEDELRQNIALLVVPSASEEQMGQILEGQSGLQEELGGVRRIAETDIETIARAYEAYGVSGAEELAEETRNEAERLVGALE